MSLADAVRNHARSERDVFEHEIRIVDRSADLEADRQPGRSSRDSELRNLEDRAIRLERDRASKAEILARRQKDVANRRMRLFEAQTAVLSLGDRT